MEQKLLGIWNKMDLFFKTITVMLGVTLVILLLAINDHNTLTIVFSIFQVIGLVVASLIHINVIISVKKWTKYVILLGCVCFSIIGCVSIFAKESIVEKALKNNSSICKVNIHINFESNLLFDRYDVYYDFGGYTNGKLYHGEDTDFEAWVEPGKYTLEFKSTESSSVKGSIEIDVKSDVNASYNISCYSDNIKVEVEFVENLGVATENEVMMPVKATEFEGMNFNEVETKLRELGFSNISTEILYDIIWGFTKEGETEKVSIDGNSEFNRGEIFSKDAKIVITYHMNKSDDPNEEAEETNKVSQVETDSEEDTKTESKEETQTESEENAQKDDNQGSSVIFSTNDSSTVKNGNSGIYAYKKCGPNYDIYYIIDFDQGYVYSFPQGEGNESGEKLKIQSGTLNDKIVITYHVGEDSWSYNLYFKTVDDPSTLIVRDNDGFEDEYMPTDLSSALSLKKSKDLSEY